MRSKHIPNDSYFLFWRHRWVQTILHYTSIGRCLIVTVNVATKIQIPSDEQYIVTCRTPQDRNIRRASGGRLFDNIFHHVTIGT